MSTGHLVDQAVVDMCSALGDETRWSILTVLHESGLVETVRARREVQYRVIGAQLSATARRLDAIGSEWDRRLASIKQIAEDL